MSEYQYYEFQALDRPLTQREMRELRKYSTRATITDTRFVNHYEWGNFKGDASKWMRVALHVNLDKTAALSRETVTAQAARINRCWLVILRCARAAAIRLARSSRTSSGCPRCHVAGVM